MTRFCTGSPSSFGKPWQIFLILSGLLCFLLLGCGGGGGGGGDDDDDDPPIVTQGNDATVTQLFGNFSDKTTASGSANGIDTEVAKYTLAQGTAVIYDESDGTIDTKTVLYADGVDSGGYSELEINGHSVVFHYDALANSSALDDMSEDLVTNQSFNIGITQNSNEIQFDIPKDILALWSNGHGTMAINGLVVDPTVVNDDPLIMWNFEENSVEEGCFLTLGFEVLKSKIGDAEVESLHVDFDIDGSPGRTISKGIDETRTSYKRDYIPWVYDEIGLYDVTVTWMDEDDNELYVEHVLLSVTEDCSSLSNLYGLIDNNLINLNKQNGAIEFSLDLSDIFGDPLSETKGLTYKDGSFFTIVDPYTQPRLGKINPNSGVIEFMGYIRYPSRDLTWVETIASNTEDGKLYAAAGGETTNRSRYLIEIDPETAIATDQCAISGTLENEADAMTFVNGTLYIMDMGGPPTMYTVNIETGSASHIGYSSDHSTGDIQAMTYDSANDTFFGHYSRENTLLELQTDSTEFVDIGESYSDIDYDGKNIVGLAIVPLN